MADRKTLGELDLLLAELNGDLLPPKQETPATSSNGKKPGIQQMGKKSDSISMKTMFKKLFFTKDIVEKNKKIVNELKFNFLHSFGKKKKEKE